MNKFLDLCAQVEETASLIYLEFASSSQPDKELQSIWQKMARDEQQHAQQLRLAIRLPKNESIQDVLAEDCPEPAELLLRSSEILEDFKEETFSILKMLKAAVELEKDFLKIHATYALTFKTPSLKQTFEALARADQHHTGELNGYIRKFKAKHAKNQSKT